MSYFNSNIRFLTEYNELLIERMKQISTDHIESVSVGDDVAFKLADEQGHEFYSSSVYDQVFEAKVFLDGVNFDNTGFILMGIGSSAIVKTILENKTEAAWFLIIEKDTALVKGFLEKVDLSPYLEGKMQRLIILSEMQQDISIILNTYINSLIGYYLLQAEFLRTFATYRRDSEYYGEVVNELVNHLRNHMTAMGNSLEDTLQGMTNELHNVPIALQSQRLSEFKDMYKDKPIICVASGPSLDKQLPLLKQIKGKALIICAESAFRVLLKNGISPDVVCILERETDCYELSVKGVDIPEDTALFGLTLMDRRIPREWNSYVVPVFKENIAHSRLMNKALGDMGSLYNGNSVAHLNYSLAHHFGGSPIVFIGQDLAYSDEGTTHSKYSFYVDDSDMDMSAQQRQQIKDSLRDDEGFYNKTVYLDGYYGDKVRSKELWRQFQYWMEHLIKVLPTPLVINATEGGVDIKDTVKMPFKEVIEQYCTGSVMSIPELFAGLSPVASDFNVKEKLISMIDFFNDQLGELEQVSEFAKEVQEAVGQLQEELEGYSTGNIEFLEMKARRVLRNVEHLLKDVLKKPYLTFVYRPLISNYHVKLNPISRVSSIERLQQILMHQSYLLKRIIKGKQQVFDVYEKGIRDAVLELGYDSEELYLNIEPKWEFPDWEEEEESASCSTILSMKP